MALGDGNWDGLIPDRNGSASSVWSWSTDEQSVGESWQACCDRCAAESARIVAAMTVEEECDPSVQSRLYFNFTYVPPPAQ